jgi:phage shock protein C
MDSQKQLRRSNNKMIAGVCGGIAEYANMDPALVRLAVVLLALVGGPGVILYIVLWAVMAPPQ